MRLRERIIGVCVAAVLLGLIICLAIWSCRDLFDSFGDGVSESISSLPLPAVLLFAFFPIGSVLLAAFLVLRSLAKVKRRESEEEKEDEDF